MYKINDIRQVNFPKRESPEGYLYVYQHCTHIPFDIKRLFAIKASKACERGHHAHKECTQLLISLNGICEVLCDDGHAKARYALSNPNEGLLVPPTIWAEQTYQEGTILMVLTDQLYDENDYIRDYNEFLKFRGIK